MKIFNKHVKTLSQITTSGLGLFLVMGLNGCDSNNKNCNKYNTSPQNLKECQENQESTVVTSSGYFGGSSGSGGASHLYGG